MDHNNFETNMIDFVNHNYQVKEELRNERLREDQESLGHLRRCKIINAAAESLVWIAVWICFLVVMFYAYWIGFLPVGYAVVMCSAFGFIVGARISTLVTRVKKYGGGAI